MPDSVKEKVLLASEEDTIVTRWVTGVPMRILRNRLGEEHLKRGEQDTPSRNLMEMGLKQFRKVFEEGDAEWGSLACGQVAGRIHDIPSCRELIQGIVAQAEGIARSVWEKTASHATERSRR